MAIERFDPPFNPSWAWDVTDEFSTIVHPSMYGHVETRARRDRKLRRWRLLWVHADLATAHYLRAFFEQHLGGVRTFDWVLPDSSLFTPGPAVNELVLAQGAGGGIADATYDVAYQYNNGLGGETLASPIKNITVAAGSGIATILVTVPGRLPADALNFEIFAEVTGSPMTLQGSIANPNGTFTISSILNLGPLTTGNNMAGIPLVRGSDRPRFREVAAGVWRIEVDFEEVLL